MSFLWLAFATSSIPERLDGYCPDRGGRLRIKVRMEVLETWAAARAHPDGTGMA